LRISLILLFLTLTQVVGVLGQSFDDYVPLSAQGPIPADFTTRSSEKFDRAKRELKGSETDKGHQAKQNFLLESNFLIDQVLGSGRVLFNDPVSNYLSELLDTILVEEPELRAQIRVYAVRSAIVNSFTTDNGIILVNLGLIAQLENESQLAFILCHELAHFTEHQRIQTREL
jgi:beta-barrel assembly-enhancing protease